MIKLKKSILLVMVVLLSFLANAQETTSEIQGMISNGKQEPLPFVTVIATHVPTGTKYGTTTREDGRYN